MLYIWNYHNTSTIAQLKKKLANLSLLQCGKLDTLQSLPIIRKQQVDSGYNYLLMYC